jgi:phosphatidylglycerol---prolipoprotein diacylglyceryl transferase
VAFTHIPALHFAFEALAYGVGFQLYLREKRQLSNGAALSNPDDALWVLVGAVLGAALGSKILYWFELPGVAFAQPLNPLALMAGKSVVGGFLGGLCGVEWVKKRRGITRSTGDAMAIPILIGLAVGRVGCFAAGLSDNTHGNPTSFFLGYDFGDGIPRHATQLYEIAFALAWATLLSARRRSLARTEGDLFKVMLSGYLLFRFGVEFIKPLPTSYAGLSGIQCACVLGLAYYARHAPRLARGLIGLRGR